MASLVYDLIYYIFDFLFCLFSLQLAHQLTMSGIKYYYLHQMGPRVCPMVSPHNSRKAERLLESLTTEKPDLYWALLVSCDKLLY